MATRDMADDGQRAASEAGRRPVEELVRIDRREERPDRFADLLECMADLRVEVCGQRVDLARHRGSHDPRVDAVIARVSRLERSLAELGAEAASVHQMLQHVRLI